VGGVGGGVLNGMRISLISSPNSKEGKKFYFLSSMFENFHFLCLCLPKRVGE
jgi:hypothetical protein